VPSETLQDVPVMVRLDSSRIEYDKIRDGAADLRFVDDEGRELTYEIERWDPAGDSWLWVKVPQVAAVDQHLFAYYDNQAAVAPAFEDSVWSNGYLSVFHLSDPLADSVGTVELVESDTLSGSGKIGLARVFTESKANIELSDDDALDDLFATGVTLSGWIRIDRFDAWQVFFAKADDPYDPFEGYLLVADGSSMAISGRSDAALGKSWDSPQLNEAQWHWFAFSYDPEDPGGSFMMVDQIVTSFGSDGPDELASDAPFPMVLAPDNEDDSAFLGALDEIRISAGRRSVSWLAFQRMAMNDELFVFDAVQARPVCTPTPE
jgi:hypothetical protein